MRYPPSLPPDYLQKCHLTNSGIDSEDPISEEFLAEALADILEQALVEKRGTVILESCFVFLVD